VEYLTPEMFTEEGIEAALADDIKQKETMEFQLENLRKQVDDIKSKYFKELLIFERKKEHNKSLIPDKVVLEQMKSLERESAYKGIKAQMDSLKISIKEIDEKIEENKKQLIGLFKFSTVDIENYLEKFLKYLDSGDKSIFVDLMEFIFKNEFKNKRLYHIVNLQRNIPIFELLIEKAPDEYKWVFYDILEENYKLNNQYEDWYMEEFSVTDRYHFLIHLEVELERFEGEAL